MSPPSRSSRRKSASEVSNTLAARKAVVSYDVPRTQRGHPLSALLADAPEADTEEQFMGDALKRDVRGLLAVLPGRERHLMERRYGLDGGGYATLQEVGREIGGTREQARQIRDTALRKLRSQALEAELDSLLEPPEDRRRPPTGGP